MDWTQALTIIGSILIPTMAGIAWMISWLRSIDKRVGSIEIRVSIIETILAMSGKPIKINHQERTDP